MSSRIFAYYNTNARQNMDVKDVTRWRRGAEGRMRRRTYIAEFTTPRYRRLLRIKE